MLDEETALLRALGVRVRRLRGERGWSRRALGSHTDLSERFLAQIEAGEGNPSVQSLARIARALETTPSELLASPPRARVVALLGLRGAGKSTVGRALAARTGAPFVELDARIEEAAGLTLGEIFELHGEDYYRSREREALERVLAGGDGTILAAGGGIVTHPENFALLRRGATTVWLRATPEDHWDRVVAQGDHRPMANDPLAKTHLRELLARREDLYRTADQTIDTSGASVESIVDRLAPLLMV
jgi:XRE family transcriptional regulator, aerobic/anaerobic benzoate catabolism transcriptional regulator